MKLWGSRFEADISDQTLEYTHTIDVDGRIARADLWGSLAHILMLCRQEIVNAHDGRLIVGSLLNLLQRERTGDLVLDKAREDVHLNVEGMLIDTLGLNVGGRLHTARSRNDQVVTDCRLYVREQILDVVAETCRLARDLLRQAEAYRRTAMIGHTHSQAAQPISYAFWLTGHSSVFLRDARRLLQAYETVNENPLGACAIAGTSFPIDRSLTTRLLGFDRVLLHALDATSSRDFLTETTAFLAILMTHVSRLAEELVVWTGFEYGTLTTSDQFATGSSIMPQKKNPVVAELARARTGTVIGCLVELLTLVKGVAMGYSCDLQQDKPPVWRAFDTVGATVSILRAQIAAVQLNAERCEAQCFESFVTATELANHLVTTRGTPFRQAYRFVGEIIKSLLRSGKTLADTATVQALLSEQGIALDQTELHIVLSPLEAVARQTSQGGTSPESVFATAKVLARELEILESSVSARRATISRAFNECMEVASRFLAGEALDNLLGNH